MTNNEEMALKLKAAAEKAGAEEWQVKRNAPGEYEVMVKGSLVKHSGWSTHRPVADEIVDKKTADFIATASPANILSLLAERHADKKRIAELEALTADQDKRLVSYAGIATKNASEERKVSVQLPEPFTKSMYGTALYEHDDIVTMLAAAGIKLEVGE